MSTVDRTDVVLMTLKDPGYYNKYLTVPFTNSVHVFVSVTGLALGAVGAGKETCRESAVFVSLLFLFVCLLPMRFF